MFCMRNKFFDVNQFFKKYKTYVNFCLYLQFVPMVVEAHGGGWSPLARATLDWISKHQASCHNDDPAAISLKIAQRISCTLHRENARAILQRAPVAVSSPFPPSGWDEAPVP